jgi:hypothetical protein
MPQQEQDNRIPHDFAEWNLDSAELAYTIISQYVEHTQMSGIVIAMMAHGLGEDKLNSLVQSEYWQSYQASRHALNEAKTGIEQLTGLINRMRGVDQTEDKE